MAALTCPQLLHLRRRAEEDCPNPGVLVQDEEKSDSGPDRNCHCGDAKVYHLRLRTTPAFRSLCPGEGGQVPGRGGYCTSHKQKWESGFRRDSSPEWSLRSRDGALRLGHCEGRKLRGRFPVRLFSSLAL